MSDGMGGAQLEPQGTQTKSPVWLPLFSLIAGIAGLVTAFAPAPPTARFILAGAGAVMAVIGIVLGAVALQRRWRKALALSGVIVSGASILLIAALVSLVIIADYQQNAVVANNAAEHEARIEAEAAAEEARFAQSEWLDEARADADLDAYIELDAEMLAEVTSNPSDYEGQEFVLKVTMGEPLIHEGMWAQGLCLAQAYGVPAVGDPSSEQDRIALVDRGGEDACPIVEQLLGIDDGQSAPSLESITAEHLLWVSPFGTIPGSEGDLPLFVVVAIDESGE